MNTFTAVIIVLALALASCHRGPPHADDSDAGNDVVVAMDRKAYRIDDLAQVTIVNTTDRVALFALTCDAFVEGRDRDHWRTVFAPDCSNIRVIATRLDGGDSITTEFRMACNDENALPLYYAFRLSLRFQFEDNSGYHTAYSSWFTLDGR
jgi:hypothetical protein